MPSRLFGIWLVRIEDFTQWWRILRHPTFIAWSLLTTATFAGLFAFLAGSSFVFIDALSVSPLACGAYIAGCSVCYVAGTFWCRRWLQRHGMAGALKRRAGFILAGGAVLIGAWLGVSMNGTVYPMTLTIGVMSICTAAVAWTLVQRHGEAR